MPLPIFHSGKRGDGTVNVGATAAPATARDCPGASARPCAPTNEGSKIRISCVSSMPVRHIFRPAPGAPSSPGGYRHTPCRAQVCQRAGKGRVARGHGKALAPPEPSTRLHVCSLFFSTKKYRQINISYLCRANRRPGCFRTEITLPWQFGIGVAAGLKVMGRLFSVVKQMKNISASRLAE